MAKDYGFDFSKLSEKIEQMADKIAKDGENVERVAEKTGEQVGESFVDGIEQGFNDAANRITASSLKINKAFKDLAKKITNQKDIFKVSLGGKNVVLDIDFSNIDINSKDFQEQVNKAFEKFKLDHAIEFDSKASEKQFKNMLGLYTKYATKLSNLQTQKPKLTNQTSIKANAQEQLAVIDGLKEIQRVMEQVTGMSVSLPHVYFGDTKELRNTIDLIEQMAKGEEKVAKQRDTNVEKIKKENKELKERNKLLEEKVGSVEEGQAPPARKPNGKKTEHITEVKASEQVVIAEQTQLDLAKEELKVEKEITKEKEKQVKISSSANEYIAYHGTKSGGFKEYDMSKTQAQDALFFTDDKDVAKTYSDGVDKDIDLNSSEIQKGIYTNKITMKNPYIVDAKGKNWDEIGDIKGDTNSAYNIGAKKFGDGSVAYQGKIWDIGGEQHSVYGDEANVHKIIASLYDPDTADVIIARLKKQQEIQSEKFEQGLIIDANDTFRYNREKNQYPNNLSNLVAEMAFAKGHDGVIFKNMVDYGGGNGSHAPSTVYAVQNSSQAQIIDPTTNIKAKADEQSVVAEQTQLNLAKEELKVEKEITDEMQKQEIIAGNITSVIKTQTKVQGKSQKPETYETTSGQMSMLPAVEEEISVKNKLADVNDKVAKSQKKVKEVAQGTQMSIDDIVPKSAEDVAPKVESEAKALDKVGEAADKAAQKKEKLAEANKKVGESTAKSKKIVSNDFSNITKDTEFSTRDYEQLYNEMEAFAEQRKRENGYDLSKVSVNTDAHGSPLGATISYSKKATKETITEVFQIDKAAQEAEDGIGRLVLVARRATTGVADLEKATLGAINKQNTFAINTEKTISTMSAALDKNANRTLVGKDGENEVREKLEAIKAETEKLKQDPNGVLEPLSEREFLATKKRIAELIQETRVLIREKKNAAYGETLESNAVDAGTYRKDNLKAQINEWKRAGIYVGDLQKKGEALLKVVDSITDHAGLKKYLIGVKEANALAKLAIQDKKAEEEKQKALNAECEEYIKLVKERNAIEKDMIGLDPEKDKDKLAALRRQYTAKDNEINGKYGDFLARDDVQEHLIFDELAERYDIDIKKGAVSDKKRKEEEAAAQKQVNEAYREYIRLVQERGRESVKLAGLDPEKNKAEIDAITAHIDSIDDKLNGTYGGLLSNHIAQATLTLEDFMKYYDKWQQKLAEKEAKVADKARQKEEKPYRDYGKTTANSAVRKRDNIQGEADALGVTNNEVIAKMDVYKAKVQEVLDLRAKFANDPEAAKDPALVRQFQKAAAEAERTRRGIKAVIDEEQRMIQMSSEQGFEPIELSSSQISNLENEMIAHAQATAQGRMEIKGWNDDHTKMYYTVTNSKGVVEEMTMALGQGTNTMYQYRTATKETGTLIQQVFKGIKTKAKELLSFVIGGGSVYKVIELLRQGIQYVRDIDLALTELKKVTDETEESYDKFLDTAAKTADRVGSTIQKVVSSTADWARLGYSMEQAAKFAESTQILMNVSEFTDVSQATDTLISSVQAFGYTAETSMDVVDLLNTIGKIIAYR